MQILVLHNFDVLYHLGSSLNLGAYIGSIFVLVQVPIYVDIPW